MAAAELAHHSARALGTGLHVVVSNAGDLTAAASIATAVAADIDRACSRFRTDSEIQVVQRLSADGPVHVSALLLTCLEEALLAAHQTDGLVDPTVGASMCALGYDRDFSELTDSGPTQPMAVPGYQGIVIDRGHGTAWVAPAIEVDLGATAKGLAADLAVSRIVEHIGGGVLVSLGGDIAVAGPPPPEGWPVLIGDDSRAPLEPGGEVIALEAGGLATSSTTTRRWRRDGRELHHILDPRTGLPAAQVWRTVSVLAPRCVDANVASTAAIVLGEAAVTWLGQRRLGARLVRADGHVVITPGWPDD